MMALAVKVGVYKEVLFYHLVATINQLSLSLIKAMKKTRSILCLMVRIGIKMTTTSDFNQYGDEDVPPEYEDQHKGQDQEDQGVVYTLVHLLPTLATSAGHQSSSRSCQATPLLPIPKWHSS